MQLLDIIKSRTINRKNKKIISAKLLLEKEFSTKFSTLTKQKPTKKVPNEYFIYNDQLINAKVQYSMYIF